MEKLISEKRVKVNNKLISLGEKATINDLIEIDEKRVLLNLKHEYYLLNKPKGYICQRKDKLGKEAISLIENDKNRNLFSIGRLDVNTTGLIIITTDGELATKVSNPKNKIYKTYLAWIDKPLNKEIILNLKLGTKLDDSYLTKKLRKFKLINNSKGNVLVKMTLFEGKKNQIRRMFDVNGLKVINLKRIQIGLHKIDGIELGKYKKMSKSKMYEGLGINYE